MSSQPNDPPRPETPRGVAARLADLESIRDEVIEALRTVFDPELPVNLYDPGLIYTVDVSDTGFVAIQMTLTSPGCPEAQTLPLEVESRLMRVPGVSGAQVTVVWEPPWNPMLMSEAAKLELGMI